MKINTSRITVTHCYALLLLFTSSVYQSANMNVSQYVFLNIYVSLLPCSPALYRGHVPHVLCPCIQFWDYGAVYKCSDLLAYLLTTVTFHFKKQWIYRNVSPPMDVSGGDGLRASAAVTDRVTLRSCAHFRLREGRYSTCQSIVRDDHGGLCPPPRYS